VVRGDTRSQRDLDGAVRRAVRTFGRLDMLVNNAGIGAEAPVVEMTEEQWRTVVDINLTGYFHGFKAVLPHMVERSRGTIVSISSVAGRFGGAGGANYSAAKWGVIGLSKAVARECGEAGVRANVVVPTFIDTPQITSDRVLREVFFPDLPNPTVADLNALARESHELPVGILPPEDVAGRWPSSSATRRGTSPESRSTSPRDGTPRGRRDALVT
jgi:NAD(P)-dependent dehydrogenase (short-subunit alcohol dehydrogenase family)